MDLYRFYVPDLGAQVERAVGAADAHNLASAVRIWLPDDQGHHARSVLRLEEGEAVVLFDGAGTWCEARFSMGGGKREVGALVGLPLRRDPLPGIRLTLACAVPKGERAEWLVEQASQLYVMRLQWLACDRGVVKPREGGGKIEKWRRLAVESAKQCGRTHVMGVSEPVTLEGLVEATPVGVPLLWLDPRAETGAREFLPRLAGAGEVVALVGPEGGWSDREAALLGRAGEGRAVHRLRLTETVLRIETAASTLAAVLLAG